MKVAVAASGTDLEAPTDPRFGRCQAFVVVDTDTMAFQTLPNTAAMQGSGAGIAAVQLVAGSGAEAVIADNIGPNAFQALSAGGLKVYRFSGGTVRQAVEALLASKLDEIGGPNVASHYGMGAGRFTSPDTTAPSPTQSLTERAEALEAQVADLRRQIAELQDKQAEGS